MRAGTENPAASIAFAYALERAIEQLSDRRKTLTKLRDTLLNGLQSAIPRLELNGDPNLSIPNTLNLRFPGWSAEDLALALDLEGISVGTGSACATGETKPSQVLLAMNRSKRAASESIRITPAPSRGSGLPR